MKFGTRCIQDIDKDDQQSLIFPIYQSSTYFFKDSQQVQDFYNGAGSQPVSEYSRILNPTVRAVEKKIAALEHAGDCLLSASGASSLNLVLQSMVRPGSRVLILRDSYRGSSQLLAKLEMRGFLKVLEVENSLQAIESAFAESDDIKLVLAELPSNPRNRVVDIESVAQLCKKNKAKLLVDATLSSPYNCNPLQLGADLVMHSATKYLAGHNDVLAGALLGKEGLISGIRELFIHSGALLEPQAAFLLGRGLKTLALRMERQNESALAIAQYLEDHDSVKRVWYSGLASHPDHDIAKQQMTGYGAVLSVELDWEKIQPSTFLDRLQVFQIGASLGGVESLIQQPGIFSYGDLTPEEREQRGLGDNFLRLAVGIEDIEDLKEDLGNALRN